MTGARYISLLHRLMSSQRTEPSWAFSLRRKLNLFVYRENERSIQFHRKWGFEPVEERVDKGTWHIEILMEYGL